MSAAELVPLSSLQLTAGSVVMAVENSSAKQGNSVGTGAELAVSGRKFVVATAAPTFQGKKAAEILDIEQTEIDMEDILSDFSRTMDEKAPNANTKIRESFNALSQKLLEMSNGAAVDPKKFLQDIKTQLTQLESATGLEIFGQMNEQLDEIQPESSDETSESGSSFGGMSSSDLHNMQVLLASMMTVLQSSLTNKQSSEMEFSSAVSRQTLGMIVGQNLIADQNADDQAAQAAKQKKISFWSRIGMIAASAIAVAAIFVVCGPVVAAVAAALIAAQMSGALNKMFSGIDSPALKMLAEIAFVVAVTVATAGVAGFVELSAEVGVETAVNLIVDAASESLTSTLEMATSALETVLDATPESIRAAMSSALEEASTALESAVNSMIEGLTNAVRSAMDTFAEIAESPLESLANAAKAAMNSLFSSSEKAVAQLSDDALENAFDHAMRLSKTAGFMIGTQTLLSTDVVPMLSTQLMDLFFRMCRLDKNSKAAHIVEQSIQVALMIMLTAAMTFGVSGTTTTSNIFAKEVVTQAGTGLMAASGGFSLASGGLNIWNGAESFKTANLQEEGAYIKALSDQAQLFNQQNLDWMNQTQEADRKQLESLGENCRAAWQCFALINQAVARALA